MISWAGTVDDAMRSGVVLKTVTLFGLIWIAGVLLLVRRPPGGSSDGTLTGLHEDGVVDLGQVRGC